MGGGSPVSLVGQKAAAAYGKLREAMGTFGEVWEVSEAGRLAQRPRRRASERAHALCAFGLQVGFFDQGCADLFNSATNPDRSNFACVTAEP